MGSVDPVGCWRALKCLTTLFSYVLINYGAFTKFAIFETSTFLMRRSQVIKKLTDFVFLTVLIYTIE